MNEGKQWHVVYTQPGLEKKVAAALQKKKIETYCPFKKVEQQWALTKRVIVEPLFNCQVFVYSSEVDFALVKQTEGVVNFAYWRGQLAVINPDELDIIKNYLTDFYKVTVDKIPVNNNDHLTVTNGPLIQAEESGLMVRGKSVKINLPSLGYALVAVPKMNVEVVKTVRGFKFTIKDN